MHIRGLSDCYKKGEKALLLISCRSNFKVIRNLAHNMTASNSNEITTMIFESKYCIDQNIAQVKILHQTDNSIL